MTSAGDTSWWPQRRRREAVVLAGLGYAGVYALRWVIDDPRDATAMLYAVPIALLAVAYGLRGGLVGAAIGSALFAEWSLASGADVPRLGWAVRIAVMFLLGVVVGRASDEMAAHAWRLQEEQERRLALEERRRREVEALEINDSIIQAMVAAKWMVEMGRVDAAIETLTDAIGVGQELVAELLPPTVTPGAPTRSGATAPTEP